MHDERGVQQFKCRTDVCSRDGVVSSERFIAAEEHQRAKAFATDGVRLNRLPERDVLMTIRSSTLFRLCEELFENSIDQLLSLSYGIVRVGRIVHH